VEEEQAKVRRLGRGHKQKLTNRQIHEKVVSEGHDISRATVNIHLARIRFKQKEVFIRQEYEYGDRYEFSLEPRENYLWSTTSAKCGNGFTRLQARIILDCGEGVKTYHMAVLTSPGSGFRWAYLYTNQKKAVFLDSHVKFFEMMGGFGILREPSKIHRREVVYDNMRNVVSKFIGRNEKELNTQRNFA
jgi:hypothetical protein